MTKLLHKDPDSRLGSSDGAEELLAHPWFTNTDTDHYIDIAKVRNRTEQPVVQEDFFERSNLKYFNYKQVTKKKKESFVAPTSIELIRREVDTLSQFDKSSQK